MSLDHDIKTLDLECICFKVALDEGWILERIDATETEYRWFLQAIRTYPGKFIAPQKDVDTLWHHHILDTEKYIADCKALFGRYIHHFPYSGVLNENDARTQARRFAESQAKLQKLKLQ